MKNRQPEGLEVQETQGLDTNHPPKRSFPIVGLGASAGGLLAFEKFFTHLPAGAENELAFVLIQHLDPNYKSMLVDLVQRFTAARVIPAEDGVEVQTGHVYIIPPNYDLSISNGKLHLTQPSARHGLRLPIDIFFRSLAQDQGELAIGIILSGTGSDGTQGLKSIKEAGGLVIVQTPETADFDGMPRSAISTRLVDYVLAPNQMADHLLQYSRRAALGSPVSPAVMEDDQERDFLEDIYQLLRAQTGHDFSGYKRSMTVRRFERRMVVHTITDLRDYLSLLQHNPAEVSALFNDLLIGVTSFFRNIEAFELLKEKIIPELIQNHNDQNPIRVWVPGCSTGEEAYSLAILFKESMDELQKEVKVQIFATDIDAQAIAKARQGVYLENISLDLSSDRLGHNFIHQENTYVVRTSLREMVVFAEHNLIENPPFSRLDLISCRNLLIYLSTRLQKKLLPLFHFALQDGGYLFLGNAEGLGAFGELFTTVDRKWKLYQKKGTSSYVGTPFDILEPAASRITADTPKAEQVNKPKTSLRELVERFLLTKYTPPCVIIDEKYEILYIHGHTGPYLEPVQGEASYNLLRMARAGLRLELAALVRKASQLSAPAWLHGLQLKTGQESRTINVAVYPVEDKPETSRGLLFVVFQDVSLSSTPFEIGPSARPQDQELDQEAWAKEEYFQAIIEELESANEELKSNNEEFQATNEELQSANEELETAREEMRSVNEELNTVNTELNSKLEELSQISNDMKNLLTATGIATIFLDIHLNIIRYTPSATRIINLIPGDIGRPVSDIVTQLDYTNLVQDARLVLDTLMMKEVETQTKTGDWYRLRILPYRTLENVINGVVVTFFDISEHKEIQAEMQNMARQVQDEREFAESILATVREPLVVLNEKLEVVFANHAYYEFFQTSPAETTGVPFIDIGQKQWNIPDLLKLIKNIRQENNKVETLEVESYLKNIGKCRMVINARKIVRSAGKEHLLLLTIEEKQ